MESDHNDAIRKGMEMRKAAPLNDLAVPGYVLYPVRKTQGAAADWSLLLPQHLVAVLAEDTESVKAAPPSPTGPPADQPEDEIEEFVKEMNEAVERPLPQAESCTEQMRENLFNPIVRGASVSESFKLEFIDYFEMDTKRFDPTARQHLVLRGREVIKVAERARGQGDSDHRHKEMDLAKRIARRGAFRRVENPAQDLPRWTQALDNLQRCHPHFREVTRYVENCVRLSQSSEGPLRISPILLAGPPGVGKSHFASDLAAAIGVHMRHQSMENAQTTALLLGSERYWSNATPGAMFEEIVLGEVANPLILLEEIDKAPEGSRGQFNPINALHSLLEPHTAAVIRDAAMDVVFDASLAIYIATANDLGKVPASILSRFKVFIVLPPRGAAALDLAHIVTTRAVEKFNVPGFRLPERSLTNKLAHLTAREITHAALEGIGLALAENRRHLLLKDFADCLEEDAENRRLLH